LVSFQTKNTDLEILWSTSEGKMLLYILVISNILRRLGTFNGHMVILSSFGIFFPALVNCIEKNLAALSTWRRRGDWQP
jgi:hypothetical protein